MPTEQFHSHFGSRILTAANTKGKPFQAQFEHIRSKKPLDSPVSRQEIITGAIYRDSDGRSRQESRFEIQPGTTVNIAVISDPVQEVLYLLDIESQIVTKHRFSGDAEPQDSDALAETERFSNSPDVGCCQLPALPPQIESRISREDLGKKQIEGLLCHGYCINREDSLVEFWFSEELEEVLLERKVGKDEESTWRLFNIHRVEPDSKVFTIPSHYRDATGSVSE